MPTVAELQAQLEAQQAIEAEQAQAAVREAQANTELVPAGLLDRGAKEVASVYINLISEIGIQFSAEGEMILPENRSAILDVAYKLWFTLYKGKPAPAPAAPVPMSNGARPTAVIPPPQHAAPAPRGNGGGRSAYCSCDHNCRQNYPANNGMEYDCGCAQLGCIDTKFDKPCACIRRPGEILREMPDGKWRWMPS